MPPTKQQNPPPKEPAGSAFSFVPEGIPRSVIEYLVAASPGAFLLIAFFVMAQIVVQLIESSILPIVFLPVICLVPLLSGALSCLVLERIRKKQLTFPRGALAGFIAGLSGALVSSAMVGVVYFVTKKPPFGSDFVSITLIVTLFAIVFVEAIISAFGGGLVAKFVKE